ncbi:cytochrome P450 [Streptomyces sp. WMMB 322]|uniref:cytochrome P450 n=1 Tax=Streptomyces sp. WMMB 322 TaxID=1286821 RepID=UPI000823C9E7|nr:cytochrome P450 [Streptomyces sp. WMMB 322]SCK07871.1 Cytochrome P450 [Streptomyces sp. WMMB 322]
MTSAREPDAPEPPARETTEPGTSRQPEPGTTGTGTTGTGTTGTGTTEPGPTDRAAAEQTEPGPGSRPRPGPGSGSGPGTSVRAEPPDSEPDNEPDNDVVRLYGPEFAADPQAVYDRLRRFGPLAPVEISPGVPALLVTGYRAALDLLHDPVTWSKDSRLWQQALPEDSPILPMLGWRPNVMFNDGDEHARYRQVITDGFDRIPPHDLRTMVVSIADSLIAGFGAEGRADLMGQFARVLPLKLFNRLFGLPDSYSGRLISSLAGMMEGDPEEAAAANAEFQGYIGELIAAKKNARGRDLTSWFLDHPAELDDEEVTHQIVLTMGAGHEPTTNLIGNALSRMLTDERYYSTLSGGALTPRDAIQDVLLNEPPISNYSSHFPRRDVYFHGTWVRSGQLVMVSYAAAGAAHGRTAAATGSSGSGVSGSGGGAHLAWSAGPHSCPVPRHALLIATTAIERLTAWLSDIELTVPHDELAYRPGPFHRALVRLPARFTPISPDQAGATPWDSRDSRDRRHTTGSVGPGSSGESRPPTAPEAPRPASPAQVPQTKFPWTQDRQTQDP